MASLKAYSLHPDSSMRQKCPNHAGLRHFKWVFSYDFRLHDFDPFKEVCKITISTHLRVLVIGDFVGFVGVGIDESDHVRDL